MHFFTCFALEEIEKVEVKFIHLFVDAESMTDAIVCDVRATGVNFAEGDYANAARGTRTLGGRRVRVGATVGFLVVITTFVASAGS